MQAKQPAWQRGPEERAGAGSDLRAPASGAPGLPPWASLPAADRYRLVNALLQLARRQAAARPVSGRQKA
jgi:hypothetical protein